MGLGVGGACSPASVVIVGVGLGVGGACSPASVVVVGVGGDGMGFCVTGGVTGLGVGLTVGCFVGKSVAVCREKGCIKVLDNIGGIPELSKM